MRVHGVGQWTDCMSMQERSQEQVDQNGVSDLVKSELAAPSVPLHTLTEPTTKTNRLQVYNLVCQPKYQLWLILY